VNATQTHQTYTLSRTGIDLLRPVKQLFRFGGIDASRFPASCMMTPALVHAYARAGENRPCW
jgi:hypothetical protein